MTDATPPQACAVDFVSSEGPASPVDLSPELAHHTTLRVGGPARRVVVATTEAELIEAVRECDAKAEPALIVGGGSNLLVSDEGFDGALVLVNIKGVNATVSDCAGANVTVGAGENWDDFVAYAVSQEWIGIETLSGIPGLVGATPIQNVGAYGTEVSQTIASVRTWDRQANQIHTFAASDCDFDYRSSRFKAEPGRWVVLAVSYQFKLGSLGLPIAYPELARHLGVEVGQRVESTRIRDAVLAIRGAKGMVLNPLDHDTWSAGSFFTNPLLTTAQADALPPEVPRYPAGDLVKTSAAWLIQSAGFGKGYGNDRASLSTKHVLALTNRGSATSADLVALAREVRDGVLSRFGIRLVPEVNLVGTKL